MRQKQKETNSSRSDKSWTVPLLACMFPDGSFSVIHPDLTSRLQILKKFIG